MTLFILLTSRYGVSFPHGMSLGLLGVSVVFSSNRFAKKILRVFNRKEYLIVSLSALGIDILARFVLAYNLSDFSTLVK